MLNQNYKTKESCSHPEWIPHFDYLIDKTETTMRVGTAILCKKCGMWRTKVLEFRFPKEINPIN